jgi:hypothetical protein
VKKTQRIYVKSSNPVLPLGSLGWSFQSQEMASSSNKKLPQPEEGSGLEAQTSSDEFRFQPSLHGLKIQKDMKDMKDMEKHVM